MTNTLPNRPNEMTSKQLHEALLADRVEAFAVLLVDPGHPRVVELYGSWGYRRVGSRRPFADSPNYAVMVRDLTGLSSR
ncbi:acetyltransferase [Streptomyces microflavus]|uniref:acetyltransferase n=1 Tax=Streptomyces microflavus TaxID=1919 RepID=UPI0034322472